MASGKPNEQYQFPERPPFEEMRSLLEDEEKPVRFLEKAKQNPFVPLGITLGLGALGYSIYNFRRSNTKLSLYLIHTRVAAQGAVVGALTLGVLYKMYDDHFNKKSNGI